MRFRVIMQHDAMQCGAACLLTVCQFYGRRNISLERMAELCAVDRTGVSIFSINRAAQRLGFETLCAKLTLTHLQSIKLPCILFWNSSHFVVLFEALGGRYIVGDPACGTVVCSEAEFSKAWLAPGDDGEPRGIALGLSPTDGFTRGGSADDGGVSLRRSLPLLWAYVRPHRWCLAQLAAGLALGCLVQLFLPFLAQAVVDVGVGLRDVGALWALVIAQVALVLGRAAAGFVRSRILLRVGMSVNIDMVSDFLAKLMRLPMSFFDRKLTGDILQRMGDYSRVRDFFTGQALDALFSSLSIVVFSAVIGCYSLRILAVFLVGSVAYAAWISIFLRRRRALDYELFRRQALVSNKTLECVTSLQEVKLQGCGKRRRAEWVASQESLVATQAQMLALCQRQEAGCVVIGEAKNVLMTLCAAMSVIHGDMTMGMMLATQFIAGQLASPVARLTSFASAAQDVRISLERILSISRMPDEDDGRIMRQAEMDWRRGVVFRGVSFSYSSADGESPAVDGVSFVLPSGRVTAVVGASGSGKTTLIKLLLGFFEPQKGQILVAGADLSSLPLSWWRGQCGAVMHDGVIFSDSVARNIAMADAQPDMSRVREAARLACADSFISDMPAAFDTKIGAEGQQLSKGQAQRILLARAFYRNPRLLILDEATNSLDSVSEKRIVDNLDAFCAGRTTIVIAHRLSTVRNADSIIVMDHGRIAEQGTHDNLTALRGRYYELIKNQLDIKD